MAQYKSQKEIVESIAQNIEALESGNLSLEALEVHVDLVRELYERSIMLRYKAFEINVVNEGTKQITGDHGKEIEVANQDVNDTIQPEDVNEKEIVTEETPSIEFSLFDDNEEDSMVQEIVELEDKGLKLENVEMNIATETVIVEAESVTNPFVSEAKTVVIEDVKEVSFTEEKQEPITLAQAGEFLSKFQSVENELSKQLGFSKLDTLIGSFGLNERLQYINELFDGSSEVFSTAIKSLDVLPNINTAKSMTADLAIQNNWDVESDTVEEFIQKICRRYA